MRIIDNSSIPVVILCIFSLYNNYHAFREERYLLTLYPRQICDTRFNCHLMSGRATGKIDFRPRNNVN